MLLNNQWQQYKTSSKTSYSNANGNNGSSASPKKRIAIIGGGVSGILAIKSCKEESNNFDEIVCYEKTSSLGGLWKYRENNDGHDETNMDNQEQKHENITTVMYSTVANSSKEMSAFSDFPPHESTPNYMHNRDMLRYIERYAKHFDCLRHVKYCHSVKRIKQLKKTNEEKDSCDSPKWEVEVENHTQHGQVATVVKQFDAIMICIGHHSSAYKPRFVGQDKFQGEIIHTSCYKKPDKYYGKKAIVIGVGNSGIDVAVELSNVCEKVYLSTRRGCWILPRVGSNHGRPYDFSMLRRSMHDFKDYVPSSWTQVFIESSLRKRFDHEFYGIRPAHPLFTEHPTVNDSLQAKILSGGVIIKGDVLRFTENGVIFVDEEKDGLVHDIDLVVLATGYHLDFPFLEPNLLDQLICRQDNSVSLYKFIVPIDRDSSLSNLGFIGLPNALGPLFPIAEMQCRWFVQHVCGKLTLPREAEMMKDVERYKEFRLNNFTNTGRHGTQVEWIPYLDELASDIASKPPLIKLLYSDPKLFFTLYFGPSVPYQYRLNGPHCWPQARDTIMTVKQRVDAPFRTTRKQDRKDKISTLKLSFRQYNLFLRLFVGVFALFFFEMLSNW